MLYGAPDGLLPDGVRPLRLRGRRPRRAARREGRLDRGRLGLPDGPGCQPDGVDPGPGPPNGGPAARLTGGEISGHSCFTGPVARKNRTVEQVLDQIGSSAHGVVTRRELLRAGISDDEIRHRLRTGALIRQHPGVYRVGHRAPSVEARYMAAVRACGDGAVLSGHAAAYLLGLIKGRPPAPGVTAPTERRIAGVRARRSRGLDRRDWTV